MTRIYESNSTIRNGCDANYSTDILTGRADEAYQTTGPCLSQSTGRAESSVARTDRAGGSERSIPFPARTRA
jgi:hypothetical protein